MGSRTGIAWTDATWNPWMGCKKVSPGCAHCYMYREQTRYGHNPSEVIRATNNTFDEPLAWQRRIDQGLPAQPSGKFAERLRVFTCSWSDFFIDEADLWRDEAWDVIRRTPSLTYQILTKRPERVVGHLPHYKVWEEIRRRVWFGVSVELPAYIARLYDLMDSLNALDEHPRLYFVSAEPLLGPVRLWRGWPKPGWVIAGGESGPAARPAREEWFRDLRDDCRDAGIPFFLKQLGGHPDKRAHEKAILDGKTYTEVPRW